jgi:hypothetical protein
MHIWTGGKCRDYWCTTYRNTRRLRRGGWWGDREITYLTVTYRRTAIHGLTPEKANAIILTWKRDWSGVKHNTREREDGLVDLFHYKAIRKSKVTKIVEV